MEDKVALSVKIKMPVPYAFKFILRDLLFYFYLRVYKLSTAEQSLKGHLIAIWSHFQN